MSVEQSTIQRFVLCCIQPVRYKMIKDHRVSGGLFLCIRQNLGPWENFLHEMDNETTMRCRCAIEDQD